MESSGFWYYGESDWITASGNTSEFNFTTTAETTFTFEVSLGFNLLLDGGKYVKEKVTEILDNRKRVNLQRKSLFSKIIKPRIVTKKKPMIHLQIPASRNLRCMEIRRR